MTSAATIAEVHRQVSPNLLIMAIILRNILAIALNVIERGTVSIVLNKSRKNRQAVWHANKLVPTGQIIPSLFVKSSKTRQKFGILCKKKSIKEPVNLLESIKFCERLVRIWNTSSSFANTADFRIYRFTSSRINQPLLFDSSRSIWGYKTAGVSSKRNHQWPIAHALRRNGAVE